MGRAQQAGEKVLLVSYHQQGRGGRGGARGNGRFGDYRLRCFKCKKPGHRKEDCTSGRSNQRGDKANSANHNEEVVVLMATGECPKGQDKATRTWIVDSGCTAHMLGSEEGLTDFRWEKGKVVVAGGAVLESVGVGCLKAEVLTEQGTTIHVSFKDVLVVPDLGRNLLSVKKIVARGGKVIFTACEAAIQIKNGVRIPLRSVGDLFELEFRYSVNGGSEQALLSSNTEEALLWHRRLGHRNMENIRQLVKLRVGVPANVIGGNIGVCDPCEVAKHTHASFPSSGKRRTTNPMELVHMDVMGP